MSDPVSNTEIEDVLSSIRRLVSDDAKASPPRAKKDDRLVLTPSLRVPDASEAPPRDAPDAVASPAESPASPGISEMIEDELEKVLRSLAPADPSEEMAEAKKQAEAEAEAMPETPDDAQESSVTELAEAMLADNPAEEEDPVTDSALEQKIAALEKLVSQKGDGWEHDPDDLATPMFQHNPARALDWKAKRPVVETTDETEAAPEIPAQPVAEPEAPAQDTAQAPDSPKAEAPDVAEPQTASAAEPQPEPTTEAELVEDAPRRPRVARLASEQDAASAKSTVTPFVLNGGSEAEASFDDAEPLPDLLAETPLTIDEDTLRELVAEMVRRELQGALGERITRNVRKLVRREINRALVARDFD